MCVVACDRGTRFATPGQRLIVEGHSPSSHLSDVTYRSPCSGWYIYVCVDILPLPLTLTVNPNIIGAMTMRWMTMSFISSSHESALRYVIDG